MDRGSITKYLLLFVAALLFWNLGKPLLFPNKQVEHVWAVNDTTAPAAAGRAPADVCAIQGPEFKAELSTRGASLRSFVLTNKRFDSLETGAATNLVSTTQEDRSPLRADLRDPTVADDAQQVPYDDLDWKLAKQDDRSCTFTYEDANVALKKTVSATDKPYELSVALEVKNLSAAPKKHRLAIEQDSWRHKADIEGGFGKRQPELATEIVASGTKKTERWAQDGFRPEDLEKDKKKPSGERELTPEEWRRAPGDANYAAVSITYFTDMIMPQRGPGTPVAEGQVESHWAEDRYGRSSEGLSKDPNPSYTYRARVAWPTLELAPGATAEYRALSFMGPKNRDLLAALDHDATDVLKLGWGAPTVLVNALVTYLRGIHGVIGSWGWSIVLMTISVRLLLFPLSLTQIKSSAAMRRLKPEMDAINQKYKDDAAQKGLAMQELWRKNNVTHPVLGCLPMLLQMPVWFALYSALQTLVELYHVPFGPAGGIIPDLVAPGRYFIIPLVLGASSFFQQKLMPAQGDPQQQKMMLYMMPGIFVFMMLFLPAGLGVYMLTNSVLAISQQLLVERYLKRPAGTGSGGIEVRETSPGGGGKPAPALGKGKARARG